MRLARLIRHLTASHWHARLRFPKRSLVTIEQAIARAERAHAGEIRFVIETALPFSHLLGDAAPRERALELFAALRVWDTEHNNGVLIYVELADRVVEIVADRGLAARVKDEEWQGVCRRMEELYRAGRFEAGSIAGVEAVGALLARHFPTNPSVKRDSHNELPDQPTLL